MASDRDRARPTLAAHRAERERADRVEQCVTWSRSDCATAAVCSTRAAFCCVSPSIRSIDWFSRPISSLCVRLADAISFMMPVTRSHRAQDLVHRRAGAVDQRRAALDVLERAPMSFLISLAAAAERCARLRTSLGDDREAATLLAGTRRFDRSIQRQQVGLERDLVDDADDVADAPRRAGDRLHRRHDLADDFVAARRRRRARPRPAARRAARCRDCAARCLARAARCRSSRGSPPTVTIRAAPAPRSRRRSADRWRRSSR